MEKKLYEFEIDEELEHVMPPLSDVEQELLTESLLSEGCRDPLVVWNGKIVDGHNRYRICRANGISFEYRELVFDSLDEAVLWIVRNQIGRRNLTSFRKFELVMPLEASLKRAGKKRQGWRNSEENVLQNSAKGQVVNTRQELADLVGVSRDTIMKYKKIIELGDEETKDQLRKDEISANKAYTLVMDKQEEQEQNSEKEEKSHQEEGPYTALKPKEGPITPPPERTWGDIVPGFGIEQILGNGEKEEYVCPPDYVQYIAPMSIGWPEEENMDFEKAESCVEDAKQYFFHRMEYILEMISDDCINEENIAKLSDSISKGYEQIMAMLKEELKGGRKKHE